MPNKPVIQGTPEDRLCLQRHHIHSGESMEMSRELFENFFMIALQSYEESGEFVIPFLGKVIIKHVKDELVKGGKKAVLECKFIPSAELVRGVGEVKDKEENSLSLTILKNRIKDLQKT